MPYKILRKERLNPSVNLIELEARMIAEEAQAGQFIVLRIDETGERIPLTVAKKDPKRGVITIVFQEAGKTTKKLASLKTGDSILDLIGPLGKVSDFGHVGKVVFIGGGVGLAELVPVIQYARKNENKITSIIGARTKDLILLEQDIRALSDRVIVMTDDGSYGRKGLVTEPLKELLKEEKFDLAYCVGPDVMMKFVCQVTKDSHLRTIVSLNSAMVDATGMCGGCRVTVGGQTKFTCVDGPEFDGHLVDWEEFRMRQARFRDEEKLALELYNEECKSGLRP